jgi:DNA repair protein RadC
MDEFDEYDESFIDFDRSVLTAILAAVSSTPQKDAHYILETFPSFQHATRADHKALARIVGDKGAKLLRTIPDAVASMTRETAIRAASYILTIQAAREHFSALLNGRRNEAFAVIYLNSKNRLINEDLWEGSIDRATFYPREIMRRIILLDASAILIAHNHPSGDTRPSEVDIRETIKLEKTLMTIDAIMLDHLIFGEGEPYSLRENGLI